MSDQNIPFQKKLMTVILLTTGMALLVSSLGFISYEIVTIHRNMARALDTRAEFVAASLTATGAYQNPPETIGVLNALKKDPRIICAGFYDRRGELAARYPLDAPAALFPRQPGAYGAAYARDYLETFSPVFQNRERVGTIYLRSNLSALTERYPVYAMLTAGVLAVSLLAAYLVSKLLQRQISQPIESLTKTAKTISNERDYSVRATKYKNDELGFLTDTFNQMIARIQEFNAELEKRVAERTEELEASNRELGETNQELEAFSYSISHDLRAPLRSINGFSGFVLEDYSSYLPEEGRNYLRRICRGSQRMGVLIDDLLAFSRLGRQPVSRQPVDMVAMVKEVLAELNPAENSRPIELIVNDLPACQGDPVLLKQVWVNLLSNAVKYTRHRNPAVVEVNFRSEDGKTVYIVRDNGTGFDMQYASKLFGVFQRLHRADEFEGTGVGLAIVQRIVQRHGGRVWAEAKVDGGATFYFTVAASNEKEKNDSHQRG